MILSFSIPAMLPMIEDGLRQRCGDPILGDRVKRQTIRRRGPRADDLLKRAEGAGWTIPYDLHLWWKSRRPDRRFIARVICGSPSPIFAYPIEILHGSVRPAHGSEYQCIRIDGPCGWRDGDTMLFWSPGDNANGFCAEARNDGFDSPEAFRDYFVPNLNDRFDGVLFKW